MLQVGKKGIILWSALDALALKWVELGIRDLLPLHQRCEHIKGYGGGISSAHRLQAIIQQGHYQYVCRTDIKGYYGAIDKTLLQSQLEKQIKRPAYLSLLVQYLQYTVEHGGIFYTPSKGIPRGCSLSPLMGAFHLWAIDEMFSKLKLHYIRYMDDFIILTKTRHQLRKAVKLLNIFLSDMGFKKHPDKTFIGRISKGFDWMGAWLDDKGITGIAPRAMQNHLQRCRQLYEQTRNMPAVKQANRVSQYLKQWCRWAMSCLSLNRCVRQNQHYKICYRL